MLIPAITPEYWKAELPPASLQHKENKKGYVQTSTAEGPVVINRYEFLKKWRHFQDCRCHLQRFY